MSEPQIHSVYESKDIEIAYQLWAKADRDTNRYHALPYHLLDVGACAEQLWDHLPNASKCIALSVFGSEPEARKCVSFLAAIHDVGKLNRYFQAKSPPQCSRLGHLGVKRLEELKRHGEAGVPAFKRFLVRVWRWSMPVAQASAVAIGGHHGVFRNGSGVERTLDMDQGYAIHLADNIVSNLAEIFQVNDVYAEPESLNPFLAWLAGFVSVADWLGSNEEFPYQSKRIELHDYLDSARARARGLMESIDWPIPTKTTLRPVEDLVPAGIQPNALQRSAERIAQDDFGLAIIEAPMGVGKTEAAFALCERSRSAGNGTFFALPTMATANGIYPRVRQFLDAPDAGEGTIPRLLHSQAWLTEWRTHDCKGATGEESLNHVADWMSGNKRGLLYPVGVGTVDQCLYGSLAAKHFFVRLFALAGKTLIVDEVHAYDIYMGDLLECLLAWCRVLNCRVILLSATLPATRKAALLAAWGASPSESSSSYPAISWVDSLGQLKVEPVDAPPRKPIKLKPIVTPTPAHLAGASIVLDTLNERPQLHALILNTVKQAQEAYLWLKGQVAGDVEVTLFHSRFTASDRADKEADVLSSFGKNAPRNRTRILVATQVVEQSLDLDFDTMVTSLAPIDLLLQRAGRLHRHRRTETGLLTAEPDGRGPAEMKVLVPVIGESEAPKLSDPVYLDYLQYKTMALIGDSLEINSSHDLASAVSRVYDEEQPPESYGRLLPYISQAKADHEARVLRLLGAAQSVEIIRPDSADPLTHGRNFLEDDAEAQGSVAIAKTRLEDSPSLTLILRPEGAGWGWGDKSFSSRRTFAMQTVRTPLNATFKQELDALEKPDGWSRSHLRQFADPIQLSDAGIFETLSYQLTYSFEVGLTIRKKNA